MASTTKTSVDYFQIPSLGECYYTILPLPALLTPAFISPPSAHPKAAEASYDAHISKFYMHSRKLRKLAKF